MEKQQQDKTFLMDKNRILYIGCRDQHKIERIMALVDSSDIFKEETSRNTYRVVKTLDAPLMNYVDEWQIRKQRSAPDKDLPKFTSQPENIKAALIQAENLWKNVQLKFESGYFTLKQMVEETNLTYSGANDILDLLFTFGMVAFREVTVDYVKTREFTVTITAEEKKAFLDTKIVEANTYIRQLEELKQLAEQQVRERDAKLVELEQLPVAEEVIVVEEAPKNNHMKVVK